MLTSRPNIVAICPQFAAPVRPSQMGKLAIQLPRCQTLDLPHHLRWRIPWRTADEQMYVICLYCQCFHFPVPGSTYLSNQRSQSLSHLSHQYLASIPRNPHKVIRQSIDGVRAPSCLHKREYILTRSRGPLRGPHFTGRPTSRNTMPTFGGPSFLPAASSGVSRRRST